MAEKWGQRYGWNSIYGEYLLLGQCNPKVRVWEKAEFFALSLPKRFALDVDTPRFLTMKCKNPKNARRARSKSKPSPLRKRNGSSPKTPSMQSVAIASTDLQNSSNAKPLEVLYLTIPCKVDKPDRLKPIRLEIPCACGAKDHVSIRYQCEVCLAILHTYRSWKRHSGMIPNIKGGCPGPGATYDENGQINF